MESPDLSYASSPDVAPKRSSSARPKSPTDDDTEKQTYIRFLISNAEAGSVIGKGGSTITEFQTMSGARIQLSRNQEFFPGTSDRIIMISGGLDEVLNGTELVQKKLLSELQVEEGDEIDARSKLRIIVPNSSCGAIIGKGGSTIKSFQEESHAGIKISPQDNLYMGLNDRLLTLSGSIEEQMRALFLVMSKLTEDSHYSQSVTTPFSYAVPYNFGSNGMGSYYQNNKGLVPSVGSRPSDDERNNSLTIAVADEHIGAVVGRGGRNIMEISQATGARIKISDRGDFMAGTSDRKVTITGSQKAIESAESMIMHKVSISAERA